MLLLNNQLRYPNNHSQELRKQCLKLASAISAAYGRGYEPAVAYLEALAANRFWQNATLPPLPWHDTLGQARIGEPQFNLHQSVLACLAPSNPLKAIFSGVRR